MVICGLALWQVNAEISKLERISEGRWGKFVYSCNTSSFQERNDMWFCSWHLNFPIDITEITSFQEIMFNHFHNTFQTEFVL